MVSPIKVERKLTIRCFNCENDFVVELSEKEFDDYYNKGIHIQHAMPTKSPETRELLISGTCPECFNEIFKDEEDDD